DALEAAHLGADALGFNFYPKSPRYIDPEKAREIIRELPPFVTVVGLFVNEDTVRVEEIADRCGIDILQFHGDETPEYCAGFSRRVIKAFRIKDREDLDYLRAFNVSAHLLDAYSESAYGGTGKTFNWELAAEAKAMGRVILAGGLTPRNVADAVGTVGPYAVDVASGVESAPGRKDPALMAEFIRRAKGVVS
ncbi:MAG: phosphoribosylanthranilate isomerase, partial [Nitrospirota bacterium]|nr:phosphoribosylanthranilate isomerase [Nitrospirota bacterium]